MNNSLIVYPVLRFASRAGRLLAVAGLLNTALLSASWAAPKFFTCVPIDVSVYVKSRVHVRCGPGDGAIQYFAISVSDQNEANRVLSLVSTAYAMQKRINILYEPTDLSGASFGCGIADCRIIMGLAMF